jgi:hypothetical protein
MYGADIDRRGLLRGVVIKEWQYLYKRSSRRARAFIRFESIARRQWH